MKDGKKASGIEVQELNSLLPTAILKKNITRPVKQAMMRAIYKSDPSAGVGRSCE